MDAAEFKQAFPLFTRSNITYLDNATVNPLPAVVIREVTQFNETLHHFPNKGMHDLSTETTARYNSTAKSLMNFIGISEMTYAFCPNTTIGLANLLLSITFRRDETILIVANLNHALIGPILQMSERFHLKVQVCPIDKCGQVDLDAFEMCLKRQPVKLALWCALPVIFGIPLENQSLLALTQEYNAVSVIDTSRALGHHLLDFAPLGPDLLLNNAWTGLYAPQGAAFLGISERILPELQPYIVGDGNLTEVSWSALTSKKGASGMEMGDFSMGAVAGLSAGMRFLQKYDLNEIISLERHLLDLLEQSLQEIPTCHVIGVTNGGQERVGLLSFVIDGMDSHDIGMYLNELFHTIVRTGQMCAQPILSDFNILTAIQVSVAPFISEEDIFRFVQDVKDIIGEFN